jgi:hypothetical protein
MRFPRAITVLATIAAAIAGAVSASGCGGSGPAAIDPVAQAAQVTSRSGGAHMSLSVHVEAAALGQPVTMSGQGFFNYGAKEGKLSIDVSGLPSAAAAVVPSGALHMEEIFKSSAIYIGSPLFAKLSHGAHWMKLDFSRVAKAMGFNLQQLAGGQSSPTQLLEYLKAVGGTPERVGSEPVRGVPTTRYRATIDLSKLAGVLGTGNATRVREQLAKLIAQLGASKVPVDVWVDAQHRVRRMGFDFAFSPGGQQVQMRMTLELFDYGPTPSVQPPPASEVFDATGTTLAGLSRAGG